MINGIDVSSVQGTIDWNAVYTSGIEFAICKCYQGNDGEDPTYLSNISNAANAGMKVGTYNFVYPLQTDPAHPNRDPVGQAQLHFAATKTNGGFVACDIEWPQEGPDWNTWGITGQFINDWTLKYLETYSQLAGKQPFVYTYPYFANAVNFSQEISQYQLWIASYVNGPNPVIPAPWQNYSVWQNSGGTIYHLPNGAPCDTDVVNDLSMF